MEAIAFDLTLDYIMLQERTSEPSLPDESNAVNRSVHVSRALSMTCDVGVHRSEDRGLSERPRPSQCCPSAFKFDKACMNRRSWGVFPHTIRDWSQIMHTLAPVPEEPDGQN